MNPFRNRKPILDPAAFYGRHEALRSVCDRLTMTLPQCSAVIGEPRSGKTSLLYYLYMLATDESGAGRDYLGDPRRFVFAYVNSGPYAELGPMQEHGALYLWRDVYRALAHALPGAPPLPPMPDGDMPAPRMLDHVYEIKGAVEQLIKEHEQRTVVLLIDNVEGIARLPRTSSSFLHTLAQDPAIARRVAYVATSRKPLYQLYAPHTWQEPSSFWSLFDNAVYLGLLDDTAARNFILQSGAYPRRDLFSPGDIAFVLHLAGRHPDVLTIACAHVYDWYAVNRRPTDQAARLTLTWQVYEAALPLCQMLWDSLANSAPGAHDVLHMLAHGLAPERTDEHLSLLHDLERRGVVEYDGRQWRIFSDVMRRFVQRQYPSEGTLGGERLLDSLLLPIDHFSPDVFPGSDFTASLPLDVPDGEETPAPNLPPAFTHLENEVYAYLRAHAGIVCDRESIKRAIWKDTPPSDSALQKLIERIREKIEPDPRSPRKLIAVRGQGYMLRADADDEQQPPPHV